MPVEFRADDPCLPIQNDIYTDGNMFTTELDQSTDAGVRNTIFEEIPPTKCRFVRLTMIDWPRTTPPGIIESAVSGKPAGIVVSSAADSTGVVTGVEVLSNHG